MSKNHTCAHKLETSALLGMKSLSFCFLLLAIGYNAIDLERYTATND